MIIALAGRRVDAENTFPKRFPLDHVEKVRERLQKYFIANKPGYVVCSGACGADLLALETAVQLNIPTKMILSFEAKIFRATSVIDRPGEWGNLFDTIYEDLNKKGNAVILNYDKDDESAYEKTNFEILNMADLMYKETQQEAGLSIDTASKKKVALIIWEGSAKDSNDTTDHFRHEALKRGYYIEEINTLQ